MSITQEMCNTMKLKGLSFLLTDTIKIALYDSTASLDKNTVAYTTTGEVSGTGYVAGGATLAGAAASLDGDVAVCTFTSPSWPGATITARGALIYDSSDGDLALAVIDFGSDQQVIAGQLGITIPAATAAAAIMRFA